MHTGVHLGVVFHGLRHTVQASHFRQQDVQSAAVAQDLQHARGLVAHQAFGQFLPHTFSHQRLDLAVLDHLDHQGLGFRRDFKVRKTCCKSGQTQDAHRVFTKGQADMAQHALF